MFLQIKCNGGVSRRPVSAATYAQLAKPTTSKYNVNLDTAAAFEKGDNVFFVFESESNPYGTYLSGKYVNPFTIKVKLDEEDELRSGGSDYKLIRVNTQGLRGRFFHDMRVVQSELVGQRLPGVMSFMRHGDNTRAYYEKGGDPFMASIVAYSPSTGWLQVNHHFLYV
jgi:hypothetical protein